MPAEFWTDTAYMATAGAIVAAGAIPIGIAAWVLARRRREPLLLTWKPWRIPWGGFEVLAAFLFVMILIPVAFARSGDMPALVAAIIAFPFQLAALVVGCRLLYPGWNPFRDQRGYAALITISIVAWAVLTPFILLVNAAVLQVFLVLNLQPDEHPLTKLGGGSPGQQVLFLFQASFAAPLIEEILFRGVLLPWVIGARFRDSRGLQSPPLAPPAFRPWIVMSIAALVAASSPTSDPLIFAGGLMAGLALLWVTVRHGKRHIRGVYSTAALFAIIHSAIWPSPIPLFFLGLGLGWLAVRTRGFMAPAIVHGLFNAVSAVFVLRGAA